jgi:ubiquinone/menaquinone biosynthesis C-methylase UbiE
VKCDPNVVFEGSIPKHYDRLLGPTLFEPFADDIVVRLRRTRPKNLLEIASGTGILTPKLRQAFPNTRIVATDLNPAMLEFAQRKFTSGEDVTWQEADASELPFSSDAFDTVVCQFGLMFVPDKQAAMREAHRVLNRGGVFLFNVWDSMDQNAFARIAHETIASFFHVAPPTFYEIPFSFYEADLIRRLLNDCGFKSIESSLVKLPCCANSAADFAVGVVRGNPVATAIQELGVDVDRVVQTVRTAIAERFGSTSVESTMQVWVWRAVA